MVTTPASITNSSRPGPLAPGFASAMAARPIAEHADAANRQHYELPPEFFALFLGPHRKYSSCLYPTGRENLAEAETIALAETVAHAGLAEGQEILELGCGWGSLSLTMAARYPGATITARRVVTFRPGQKLKARVEEYSERVAAEAERRNA